MPSPSSKRCIASPPPSSGCVARQDASPLHKKSVAKEQRPSITHFRSGATESMPAHHRHCYRHHHRRRCCEGVATFLPSLSLGYDRVDAVVIAIVNIYYYRSLSSRCMHRHYIGSAAKKQRPSFAHFFDPILRPSQRCRRHRHYRLAIVAVVAKEQRSFVTHFLSGATDRVNVVIMHRYDIWFVAKEQRPFIIHFRLGGNTIESMLSLLSSSRCIAIIYSMVCCKRAATLLRSSFGSDTGSMLSLSSSWVRRRRDCSVAKEQRPFVTHFRFDAVTITIIVVVKVYYRHYVGYAAKEQRPSDHPSAPTRRSLRSRYRCRHHCYHQGFVGSEKRKERNIRKGRIYIDRLYSAAASLGTSNTNR